MAQSKCGGCGSTTFEVKENVPTHSTFKLLFVQCSKCGVVVGVNEWFNLGAMLDKLWIETDKYWHEGDYNRIVDLCRIVMEGDPGDDEACGAAAFLLWSMGDTKAADWILEYGSKRTPRNKGVFFHEFGWHLYNTKRYKEALPYLQKAVAAGGVPVTAYTTLAHTYDRLGDLPNAVKTWELIGKRFPNHVSWKPNLARVKAKLAAKGQ